MKKIAIVGNLIDNVTNISNFLEAKGFKTVWAYNGEDALELYEREKPEIIVSDIKLDLIDGFELSNKLGNVKFIFMSADDDQLLVARKIRNSLGALKKPIDLEGLLKLIKNKVK